MTRTVNNLWQPALVAAFALFLVFACDRSGGDGLSRAARSARTKIQAIREFELLFPVSAGSIAHYTGETGDPYWHSTAVIAQRFILKMIISLDVDRDRSEVVNIGQPLFVLEEIVLVRTDSSGHMSMEFGPVHIEFGTSEWQRIVKDEGDLTCIGVDRSAAIPVAGLDAYAKQLRESSPR